MNTGIGNTEPVIFYTNYGEVEFWGFWNTLLFEGSLMVMVIFDGVYNFNGQKVGWMKIVQTEIVA